MGVLELGASGLQIMREVDEDEDDADATADSHALAAEIQGYLSQGLLHGSSVGHGPGCNSATTVVC